MANVEIAKTAIEEELEAQRLLTEAARIKATSPDIAAVESDPIELEGKKPPQWKATA